MRPEPAHDGRTVSTDEYVNSNGYCRDCERTWLALSEAHCPSCCSHFTSDSAFDAHLTRNGCADPATITRDRGVRRGRPVFELVERSSGPAWQFADEREHPFSHLGGELRAASESQLDSDNKTMVSAGVSVSGGVAS
jgi:hypothetical protein